MQVFSWKCSYIFLNTPCSGFKRRTVSLQNHSHRRTNRFHRPARSLTRAHFGKPRSPCSPSESKRGSSELWEFTFSPGSACTEASSMECTYQFQQCSRDICVSSHYLGSAYLPGALTFHYFYSFHSFTSLYYTAVIWLRSLFRHRMSISYINILFSILTNPNWGERVLFLTIGGFFSSCVHLTLRFLYSVYSYILYPPLPSKFSPPPKVTPKLQYRVLILSALECTALHLMKACKVRLPAAVSCISLL